MRSIFIGLILFASVMVQGCASTTAPMQAPKMAPPLHVAMVAATVTESSSVPEVSAEPPKAPEVVSTDRDLAVAWMTHFMRRTAPPGRQTFYAEAQETKEETEARYNQIANAVIDEVYDPNTKPLFGGTNGRARTSSVILAVMLHESGFMRNVDFGVGKYGRGDHGNSWCLLQLNVGANGQGRTVKWNMKEDRSPRYDDNPADIFQGNTGPELVADRHVCVREGLKAMRISFMSCRTLNLPLEQKLRVFASGNCEEGEEGSRIRMRTAIKFWDDTKTERNFNDKAIVALVLAAKQNPEPQKVEPVQAAPKQDEKPKDSQPMARAE